MDWLHIVGGILILVTVILVVIVGSNLEEEDGPQSM